MRRLLLVFSFVFPLMAVSNNPAAKMYRWVDEEGNTHYTDTIPPSQVERGHQELSKDGVKTREVPRAKTKEELEREQALKRLRVEQQRLIEKQKAEAAKPAPEKVVFDKADEAESLEKLRERHETLGKEMEIIKEQMKTETDTATQENLKLQIERLETRRQRILELIKEKEGQEE